jgi:hypothetical protein
MDSSEVAAILNMSTSWMYKEAAKPGLRGYKLGRGRNAKVLKQLPRFRDLAWRLALISPRESNRSLVINWSRCPAGLRPGLMRASFAELNIPTPAVLLQQRASRSTSQPGTLRRNFQIWTRFATWLDARGITELSQVTTGDLEAYAEHLRALGHRWRTDAKTLLVISRRWAYAPYLPASDRLVMPPWEDPAAVMSDFLGTNDDTPLARPAYSERDGFSAVALGAWGASGAFGASGVLGGLLKSSFFGLFSRSSSFWRSPYSLTVTLASCMPAEAALVTEPGSWAYWACAPAEVWVVWMKEPRKPRTARASGQVSCTIFAREEAPWMALLNRLVFVSSYVSSSLSSKSMPSPGRGLELPVVTEKSPAPLPAELKMLSNTMVVTSGRRGGGAARGQGSLYSVCSLTARASPSSIV